MTVPVLVLLGYAGWTLLILFGSVGFYRWSRILTGRASLAEWRADVTLGSEWYQRAMRAHMNCIENLPLFTALVVAMAATGTRSPMIDGLAITILGARVGQTIVHITLPQTNNVVALRFGLFATQTACMIAMGLMIAKLM